MSDLKQSLVDYLKRDTVHLESMINLSTTPQPVEDLTEVAKDHSTFKFEITTVDEEIFEELDEKYKRLFGGDEDD